MRVAVDCWETAQQDVREEIMVVNAFGVMLSSH